MERIQIRQGELTPALTAAVGACLSAVNALNYADLYAAEGLILEQTEYVCELDAADFHAALPGVFCLVPREQESQLLNLIQPHGISKPRTCRYFCIPQ